MFEQDLLLVMLCRDGLGLSLTELVSSDNTGESGIGTNALRVLGMAPDAGVGMTGMPGTASS